jgi:ferrous iron transport protein B
LLSGLSHFGIDAPINRVLSPLTTHVLKLPEALGIALFLGVFRKELTLVMLAAVIGVSDVSSVLSHGQILALVVFTMLYIPCVATLAALWKEGGWRTCLTSAMLNFAVAVVVAGAVAHLAALM